MNPLFLSSILEKGHIRQVTLTVADALHKPPVGKRWLILCGEVNFVTGTDTYIAIETSDVTAYALPCWYKAGDSSGIFQLFNTRINVTATETLSPNAGSIYLLNSTLRLRFVGDATAWARLLILEFDEK